MHQAVRPPWRSKPLLCIHFSTHTKIWDEIWHRNTISSRAGTPIHPHRNCHQEFKCSSATKSIAFASFVRHQVEYTHPFRHKDEQLIDFDQRCGKRLSKESTSAQKFTAESAWPSLLRLFNTAYHSSFCILWPILGTWVVNSETPASQLSQQC